MRVVLNVEIGLIQGLSDILIPFLIYNLRYNTGITLLVVSGVDSGYIKIIYRTLLTRGMKRRYVYCTDKKL